MTRMGCLTEGGHWPLEPVCATLSERERHNGERLRIMAHGRVTGVRSIELGVRDLRQSAEFYSKVWALEEVSSETDSIHFRATGGEHHVLTIRERKKPALLGVHFAAPDRAAVDALCAKARGYGVQVAADPPPLSAAARARYDLPFT